MPLLVPFVYYNVLVEILTFIAKGIETMNPILLTSKKTR